MLEELIVLWGKPSQKEVGERLGVAREYVNRVLNGHEPSEQFRKAVEARLQFERMQGVSPDVGPAEPLPTSGQSRATAIREVPRAGSLESPSAASLRGKIVRDFEALLSAAGQDIGRLGWIQEQLTSYLAIPLHWRVDVTAPMPRLSSPRARALASRASQLMVNRTDHETLAEGYELMREALAIEAQDAQRDIDTKLDEAEKQARAGQPAEGAVSSRRPA